jgi:UDP-glucose 4-epimerase
MGLRIPPEMAGQLRYGRGLDNRKLKSTEFRFEYTTREAVIRFAEHLRLQSVLRGVREPYHYEKEVEDFLRWSPSVRTRTHPGEKARYFPPAPPVPRERLLEAVDYDLLDADEAIALIRGLEGSDLEGLRDHEQSHQRREEVLRAIDAALVSRRAG